MTRSLRRRRAASGRPARRARTGRRLGLTAAIAAIAAVVAVSALGTPSATSFPTDGQPCSCHNPQGRSTVALALSKTKAPRGTKITLTGKVTPGYAGLKATSQTSRTGKAWRSWKTATITASKTVSARWTAPKVKGKYYFRLRYLGDNRARGAVSPVKVITVR